MTSKIVWKELLIFHKIFILKTQKIDFVSSLPVYLNDPISSVDYECCYYYVQMKKKMKTGKTRLCLFSLSPQNSLATQFFPMVRTTHYYDNI